MHDIAVLKTSHHMYNGIHLADIGKELISQPFSFGRAFYKTCDIHKLDCSRDDLLGMVHLSKHIQPLIRHCHDSHVRVNGTERIVR